MVTKILTIIVLSILIIVLLIFTSMLQYIIKAINKNTIEKVGQYNLLNKNAKPNQIVFLGDSLTEFFATSEFFDCLIYNRGIAGDDTIGVLKRLHDNVIKINPKMIFLQIGTNDLGKNKKANYVYSNIKTILLELKDNLPNCKLFYISLYPVNSKAIIYSKLVTGKRKNKDIIQINNLMKGFCVEEYIEYIDIYSHLVDNDGNLNKEYTIEGLHINFEGYLIIYNVLKHYLMDENKIL